MKQLFGTSIIACAFLLSGCLQFGGTELPNPGDEEVKTTQAGNTSGNDSSDNGDGSTAVTYLLPSDDTNVKELIQDDNKGTSDRFDVWSYPGEDKYSFIKFDLAALSGREIKSARLQLYLEKVRDDHDGRISINIVRGQWSEYSLNYLNSDGLSFDTLTELDIVEAVHENTYIAVDITPAVQAWVAGEIANDGLALLPESDIVRVEFNSKEAPTNRSYLEIEYY